MSFRFGKSWLWSAFLYFCLPFSASSGSFELESLLSNQVHKDKKWHALLHLRSGSAEITSSSFLLSHTLPDAKQELVKTVQLFNTDTSAKCLFPARYIFLRAALQQSFDRKEFESCTELNQFLNYVPFDQLSLVFASEVVTSASSMMGHAFVKAQGKNINNNDVSHSLSFFSEVFTWNPLMLAYDGLIGGMDGFVKVRPFAREKEQYLDIEGRNLWNYTLNLSEYDKSLVQLHFWELKNVDIEYYFDTYNCATFVLELLAIAMPEVESERQWFVSPADVIKAAEKYRMITTTQVELSDAWEANMYLDAMPEADRDWVQGDNFLQLSPAQMALSIQNRPELIGYLKVLAREADSSDKNDSTRGQAANEILKHLNEGEAYDLVLDNYKRPLQRPQDSSMRMSYLHRDGDDLLQFAVLPASHYLWADNRQYHAESELKMLNIVANLELQDVKLSLEEFTLYSMTSLPTVNAYRSPMASHFYLGYRHRFNDEGRFQGTFDVAFGGGKAAKIHRDVVVYGLTNVTLGYSAQKPYAEISGKLGAIFHLIKDMKLTSVYELSSGRFNQAGAMQSFEANLSYVGLEDIDLMLNFEHHWQQDNHVNEVGLSFNYLF